MTPNMICQILRSPQQRVRPTIQPSNTTPRYHDITAVDHTPTTAAKYYTTPQRLKTQIKATITTCEARPSQGVFSNNP